MGLTKDESSRYQQLAAMPADEAVVNLTTPAPAVGHHPKPEHPDRLAVTWLKGVVSTDAPPPVAIQV